MSGRGTATFGSVLAECRQRPGLLLRELAWRWLYGIPALAIVAVACFHIYRATANALLAAGAGKISLDNPWQSAAIVSIVEPMVRPVVAETVLWLLPLLALGWVVVAGVGRNLVLRYYDPDLPWRPVALCSIQGIRVVALAATVALWWGSVRWSAAAATVEGMQNLALYFALVAAFSLAFLVIWSMSSWVFSIAPMFLLVEQQSLGASLRRSFLPSSVTGRLLGVNVAVALIRLGLAMCAMFLSALPLGFVASSQNLLLYLWLAAVTVLYMVVSGFFQVVRLVAFVEFWMPAAPPQNRVPHPSPDRVN